MPLKERLSWREEISTVTFLPSNWSKGSSLVLSSQTVFNSKRNNWEMASRPENPPRIKASGPRGVVSFIGRSVCSYMRSPPCGTGLPACRDRPGGLSVAADRDVNRRQLHVTIGGDGVFVYR